MLGPRAEPYRLKVIIQGQKRHVTRAIKRQLRRRSAVEPIIGHLKNEHRMTRNRLAGPRHAANAVLAPVGYNFRLLLKWLGLLCALSLTRRAGTNSPTMSREDARSPSFTDDERAGCARYDGSALRRLQVD